MILGAVQAQASRSTESSGAPFVWLRGLADDAVGVRDVLSRRGKGAVIVDDPLIPEASLPGVIRALQLAGVIAISARDWLSAETLAGIREAAKGEFIESVAGATKWLDDSVEPTEAQ